MCSSVSEPGVRGPPEGITKLLKGLQNFVHSAETCIHHDLQMRAIQFKLGPNKHYNTQILLWTPPVGVLQYFSHNLSHAFCVRKQRLCKQAVFVNCHLMTLIYHTGLFVFTVDIITSEVYLIFSLMVKYCRCCRFESIMLWIMVYWSKNTILLFSLILLHCQRCKWVEHTQTRETQAGTDLWSYRTDCCALWFWDEETSTIWAWA